MFKKDKYFLLRGLSLLFSWILYRYQLFRFASFPNKSTGEIGEWIFQIRWSQLFHYPVPHCVTKLGDKLSSSYSHDVELGEKEHVESFCAASLPLTTLHFKFPTWAYNVRRRRVRAKCGTWTSIADANKSTDAAMNFAYKLSPSSSWPSAQPFSASNFPYSFFITGKRCEKTGMRGGWKLYTYIPNLNYGFFLGLSAIFQSSC